MGRLARQAIPTIEELMIGVPTRCRYCGKGIISCVVPGDCGCQLLESLKEQAVQQAKFLNRVTLTGADFFTSYNGMARLTSLYPFAEWAILLSASKMGQENRYPALEWIQDLRDNAFGPQSLAGHLCGRWARDFIAGGDEYLKFAKDNNIHRMFGRIQLNISHIYHSMDRDGIRKLDEAIRNPEWSHVRFIIQVRSYELPRNWIDQDSVGQRQNVDVLFDCSGGRGVLPDEWPAAIPNCGYAGGLTPENVAGQLLKIGLKAQTQLDKGVWIDAESGVRTNEVFDLQKVENFLIAAAPHVHSFVS
jgi:phosphoribosylanthranilate isomerase